VKITTQTAAALKLGPGEADRIWFDDAIPIFGLRVRVSGSRSWIFQYKIGNKTRRLVIGQVSAIKAGRAREIAGEHHAKVKLGRDPAAEKRLQVQRAAHTFGALVIRYLEQQQSQLRPGSYREIARHLKSHSASLHPLPIDLIDQRIIAERLSAIERGSGAVTANRVRATVSAMFVWGMKEGLALGNPAANTNKREEKPRDRTLGDTELRWSGMPCPTINTVLS
jgi:hypothetical protein